MNRRFTPNKITELKENEVFVFGSNSTGFHGVGTSGLAFRNNPDKNWRDCKFFLNAMNSKVGSYDRVGMWAIFGVARGFQKGRKGKSYAIETIKRPGHPRSGNLIGITQQIVDLYKFAKNNKTLDFLVTLIGCQYAGYSVKEISICFLLAHYQEGISDNIILPEEFEFRQ